MMTLFDRFNQPSHIFLIIFLHLDIFHSDPPSTQLLSWLDVFSSIQTHSQLVLWHLLSQSHFQIALPHHSVPFFEFESVTWLFCGCGRWRTRSWGRVGSEVKESTNLTKHLSCWNGIAKLKRIISAVEWGCCTTHQSGRRADSVEKKREIGKIYVKMNEKFSQKRFFYLLIALVLFSSIKKLHEMKTIFSSLQWSYCSWCNTRTFHYFSTPHPGYLVNTQHDFSLLPLLVRLERLQIIGRSLNFNTN